MDIDIARKIRLAVINNDVKTLKTLLSDKEYLKLSFGRFPILSLAYLYESNGVIKVLEPTLQNITEYTILEEETKDYLRFKRKAGKTLRLYLNGQIVTPAEMAAVIGDGLAVKANLKNGVNTDRIKKIYRLTHSQEVKKKGNSIIVPRSKKPRFTQLVAVISIIAICLVFMSGGIIAMEFVPKALGGAGTVESPLKITSATLFSKALEDTTDRYYSVENDITIDATAWSSGDLSAHIDGNGHVITINGTLGASLINKLSGSLANAEIVFKNVGENLPKNSALLVNTLNGKMENLSVYMENINVTATTETALICHTSTGVISNVKLVTSGTINEVSALEETVIGTLLYKNMGIVSDVEVTMNLTLYGDAKDASGSASGESFGDAVFGGIVGLNNATITRATVKEGSTVTSNTLDLAGISATNGEKATLTEVKNYATLTQSTLSSYWSPNIGGITMRNYGKLSNAYNHGAISATTSQNKQNTSIILGGITTTNSGTIDKAYNTADISATMLAGAINVGGIGYLNEGTVSNSANSGTLSARVTETEAYQMEHHIGGAFAVNNGTLSYFKNSGNIEGAFSVESVAYIGGAVGLNNAQTASIANVQNTATITANSPQENNVRLFVGGVVSYLAGTIAHSFNTGSFITESNENAVVSGAVIGFTIIQRNINGNFYKYNSDWENNYYVSDLGYSVGIGVYYVYDIFSNYYTDGEDNGTTPTDLETLKSSEVYWE